MFFFIYNVWLKPSIESYDANFLRFEITPFRHAENKAEHRFMIDLGIGSDRPYPADFNPVLDFKFFLNRLLPIRFLFLGAEPVLTEKP